MSRLKYLHDNYSPRDELWGLVCECNAMQNILDELADIDSAIKHKKEYHTVFVMLDSVKKDINTLRCVASQFYCSALLASPQEDRDSELPFE